MCCSPWGDLPCPQTCAPLRWPSAAAQCPECSCSGQRVCRQPASTTTGNTTSLSLFFMMDRLRCLESSNTKPPITQASATDNCTLRHRAVASHSVRSPDCNLPQQKVGCMLLQTSFMLVQAGLGRPPQPMPAVRRHLRDRMPIDSSSRDTSSLLHLDKTSTGRASRYPHHSHTYTPAAGARWLLSRSSC